MRPAAGRAGRWRTPLPWLAALMVAYLLGPLLAFAFRTAGAGRAAWSSPGVGTALGLSLETASVATGVIVVFGVPLAYLLAHSRSRLATVLGVAVQLPLAVPPLMSGIMLLYIVGPYAPLGELFNGRLTDDVAGIVLAQIFVSAPFLIIGARSAFAAVDPGLADVAATLGHGRWSRFVRVALPSASGGIWAGALLTWMRAFGEFGATVILAYNPNSLPVFTYIQFGATGLTATLLPVTVSLVAAAAVLTAGHYATRLRMPRRASAAPPEPRSPRPRNGARLDFDLTARAGTFHLSVAHASGGRHLAILGPSGAGKSLTLRLIAGLMRPGEGHVRLDTVDLTGLPAEARGVGYVPQDASLLPHLPVWRQILFGVGTDPALAAYWLERLHLSELTDRLPHQLSGGQRRRVALARALAAEPRLLLLDEPFTGLDTPVRDELRRELRSLRRDTSATTVLVTHDPEEAALLADDVMIITRGRLLQSGRQQDVFAHPATPEAARLLGIRNLHAGVVVDPGTIEIGSIRLAVPPLDLASGSAVTWCIRPEEISLNGSGLAARVSDAVHIGAVTELTTVLDGGYELAVTTPTTTAPPTGAEIQISLPPSAITVWPVEPA